MRVVRDQFGASDSVLSYGPRNFRPSVYRSGVEGKGISAPQQGTQFLAALSVGVVVVVVAWTTRFRVPNSPLLLTVASVEPIENNTAKQTGQTH